MRAKDKWAIDACCGDCDKPCPHALNWLEGFEFSEKKMVESLSDTGEVLLKIISQIGEEDE